MGVVEKVGDVGVGGGFLGERVERGSVNFAVGV